MPRRRAPKQLRSHQTVEAILDSVMRVLKRHGIEGVTTNRIAEVAGVSIGSVYQYFPDKRAIFAALHDRHVEKIGRVIEGTLVAYARASLEDFVRALIQALIDAHATDAEFHELLMTVPHGVEGAHALEIRLRDTFRLAIAARSKDRNAADLDRKVFVLSHLVETLAHGAVYGRPPRLSLAAAKEEATRAVIAYLRA